MKTENEFETMIYDKQVSICKAFANPIRLRILDMIAHRPYAASELQEQLSISKANLSQHMSILRAAGVIITHREGKQVYSSLAIPEVKQACQLIRSVLRAQIQSGQQLTV
jgi:DNA-binding transcriptional ArsR family regulator